MPERRPSGVSVGRHAVAGQDSPLLVRHTRLQVTGAVTSSAGAVLRTASWPSLTTYWPLGTSTPDAATLGVDRPTGKSMSTLSPTGSSTGTTLSCMTPRRPGLSGEVARSQSDGTA
ncbi:hypothetical protein D3C81_1371580 [compost metagenome]